MSRVFRCRIRTAVGEETLLVMVDVNRHTGLNAESLSDLSETIQKLKDERVELVAVEDIGPGVISIGSAKGMALKLRGGPGGELYRT